MRFSSDDHFLASVEEYINFTKMSCTFPSIAGFCSRYNMHRTTFYDLKRHFPYTYKRVDCIFEDAIINSKGASDRIKILYLKNRYIRNTHKEEFNYSSSRPQDLSALNGEDYEMLRKILRKLDIAI